MFVLLWSRSCEARRLFFWQPLDYNGVMTIRSPLSQGDGYTGPERRHYRRIRKPYSVFVRVHREDDYADWDLVLVRDISAGGLRFAHETSWTVGTSLDLKINFSLNQPPIRVIGRVLRSEPSGAPPVYSCAVSFGPLTPAENALIDDAASRFKG